MKPRMNYFQAAADTIKALVAVEDQIKTSGLELSLIGLVKTRASQITHARTLITRRCRLTSRKARP